MEMIQALLPIPATLLIGMACRKWNILSKEGIDGLQKLMINFTLPVALFNTFLSTSVTAELAVLPAVNAVLIVVSLLIAFGLAKAMKEKDPYFPFLLCGHEGGALGFALMGILMGQAGIARFALMDLGIGISTFTLYLALLRRAEGETQGMGKAMLSMAKTPVFVGEMLGMICSVAGLGRWLDSTAAGSVVHYLCEFISAPTSVLLLVVTGYRIQLKGIEPKFAAKGVLLRMAMHAVLCCLILLLYRSLGGIFTEKSITAGTILVAILPTTYMMPLFMRNEEAKAKYSGIITGYTLLTFAMFVVLAAAVI